MRVLVLGGTGMLGHKLVQRLDATATVRGSIQDVQRFGFYCPDQVIGGVDATDFETVESALRSFCPEAVVNCIGIVKQHSLSNDPVASLTINALFPHKLAELCRSMGARLVHVSTDCVFDGARGGYTESDEPNATDLYGKTKSLGEVTASGCVTLRTSIIGREIASRTGLVEWFLSNRNQQVLGFANARFSGLTTDELASVISSVLTDHKELEGTWQVASEPIDKHSLLLMLKEAFATDTTIERDDSVRIDRTLNGDKFRSATGYVAPDWKTMVARMAADPTPYDNWGN